MGNLADLWYATGVAQVSLAQASMILVGLGLLFLAIVKRFEPLLLVPIGFGGILANIPGVEIASGAGVLAQFYDMGIGTGVFPLIIFMGVGAMTDFGPLPRKSENLVFRGGSPIRHLCNVVGRFGFIVYRNI